MTAKCEVKTVNKLSELVDGFYNTCTGWYKSDTSATENGDSAMRQYIRHPSDIPIAYCLGKSQALLNQNLGTTFFASDRLRDVSRGGLCFSADCPVRKGTPIHIEIPINNPPYSADGTVAWCRPEGDHFAVGVQFTEPSTRYSVRMVEQVCHIEAYRSMIMEKEGRELSSEEAASEWIDKYAAEFPA